MGEFGDSDDSDGEGGQGNVNRIIMRPPGHSGKAKRGHLCFDASFETGNLGRVDLINEFEYDLFIRPDTCSPRFRFWFHFTVDNVRQDQRVIFNIVNISKRRNLFNSNLTPIVRSTTRPKWQRIPKQFVFYNKSQIHRGHYVLSFAFGFDREDDIFQFAISYPYSYSRLQTHLNILERKLSNSDVEFKRELLANSVQNRRLDMLTIGGLDSEKQQRQRVVVILARIHSGESPASFICQGFIDLLVSSHPIAALLRKNVIFKIFPMLNPDGVFLGNYRSSLVGFDLNRSWPHITPWGHPTLKAVIDTITMIDKSKDFQLDFIIDIHANSTLTGCFVYGNTYEDVYRYERHIVFPKLLASVCEDYASQNTMFNSDVSKENTARRYFCSTLGDKVNCYTFEVSMSSYKLKNSEVLIPYTEESYMRCGRNLVRSFLEYYQVTGLIPVSPTNELSQKKSRPKTHHSRSATRNSNRRINTTRPKVMLHFKDLNYDTDTSVEDLYSYRRQLSTRKYMEKYTEWETHIQERKSVATEDNLTRRSGCTSPPPPTYIAIPQPSLSIIDFNIITRDDFKEINRNK